jgi:hypothetical protein
VKNGRSAGINAVMEIQEEADVVDEVKSAEDADTLTDLAPVVDPETTAREAVAAALRAMTENDLPGQVVAVLAAPFPGGSPDESPADALPYHARAAAEAGKQLQYVRSRYHGQPAWYVLLTDPVELDEEVTTAILAKRMPIPEAVRLPR